MLDLNKTDEELIDDLQNVRVSEAKERERRKTYALLVILAIIAVALLGAWSYKRSSDAESESRARMDRSGAEAKAYLRNDYKMIEWPNGKKTYEVSYTFDVGQTSYSGTCEIAHHPNSVVAKVVYDPADPRMNELRDKAVPPMDIPRLSQGGILLIATIPIILLAVGVAITQSVRRPIDGGNPTFWSQPAAFFFTSRGKSIGAVGGVLVGMGLYYLTGLIGVGIYLAVFFLVKGALNRETVSERISPHVEDA
jgi:hypothetical protein